MNPVPRTTAVPAAAPRPTLPADAAENARLRSAVEAGNETGEGAA
ncbi:hypothetical protein [Streptomyces sp. NPDC059491]